jgi:hypothetical protein
MDWDCRVGRVGGFVTAMAAGAVACGRTRMPPPSPDPAPSHRAACAAAVTPAGIPRGALALAIAGPTDTLTSVPRLLNQIVASTGAAGCAGPRPADPGNGWAFVPDTVVVRRVSDRGARDALDQGADVVVTRDPRVVAYAAVSPGLVSIPLLWDRVYVLAGLHPALLPDSAATPLRAALASDAVHTDARAFEEARAVPDTVCTGDTARVDTTGGAAAVQHAGGRPADAARILYDQRDSIARYLAERIAVLASTHGRLLAGVAPVIGRPGGEIYATGLPATELARAIAAPGGAMYIVAVSSPAPPSCTAADTSLANVQGITIEPGGRQAGIVPLIETRAWAIVRRDAIQRIVAAGERAVVAEERTP